MVCGGGLCISELKSEFLGRAVEGEDAGSGVIGGGGASGASQDDEAMEARLRAEKEAAARREAQAHRKKT